LYTPAPHPKNTRQYIKTKSLRFCCNFFNFKILIVAVALFVL
jgi:hypothetical protein